MVEMSKLTSKQQKLLDAYWDAISRKHQRVADITINRSLILKMSEHTKLRVDVVEAWLRFRRGSAMVSLLEFPYNISLCI